VAFTTSRGRILAPEPAMDATTRTCAECYVFSMREAWTYGLGVGKGGGEGEDEVRAVRASARGGGIGAEMARAGAYLVPSEALSTVAYSVSLWFRLGMTAPQTDSESRASASAVAECQCVGGEAHDGAAGGRACRT
jgi:hypothetical protein